MNFRISIKAPTERMSLFIAFHIAGIIGQLVRMEFKIGVIGTKSIQHILSEGTQYNIFEDIEKWSLTNCSEKMDKLISEGINAIFLSSKFIEWETQKETINEELYEFEKLLEMHSITVIIIESHDVYDAMNQEFKRMFTEIKHWLSDDLKNILQMMLNDYNSTSLILPPGNLPYIIADFNQEVLSVAEPLNAFVGLQYGCYNKYLERFKNVKFPFMHVLIFYKKGENTNQPKYGAIPMKIRF